MNKTTKERNKIGFKNAGTMIEHEERKTAGNEAWGHR